MGFYADGPYAYQVRGSLYAALVNSAQILDDDDVTYALERLRALPPLQKNLKEVGGDPARSAAVKTAAERLGADFLVLVRVKPNGKRHHQVSALIISREHSTPVLVEAWTITSRGKPGEEQFDYAPIRNAVRRVIAEQTAAQ